MADQNNSGNQDISKLLSDLRGNSASDQQKMITDAITQALKNTGFNPKNASQSFFGDRKNEMKMGRNSATQKRLDAIAEKGNYKHTGSILGDFEQGIKDQLLDSLAGGSFKKGMNSALNTFAAEFGVNIKDLPHEFGKQMSKKMFNSIAKSDMGQAISSGLKSKASKIFEKGALKALKRGASEDDINAAIGALSRAGQSFFGGAAGDQSAGTLEKAVKSSMSAVSSESAQAGSSMMVAKEGAEAAGGAMAGAGDALGGLIQVLGGLSPQMIIIGVALAALAPAIKGLIGLFGAFGKAMSREEELQKKRIENAQKRWKADYEYIVKEPFEILRQAAEDWAKTWDANLAKVSLTQGYTKEDVYDLYSNIAERLNSEGLGSAIAATDVIDQLGTILESGLSGKIAEEFAYEAVKLSSAIPTENFTSYASTYAQLASEAVAQGASQAEAIAYANQQLEDFASNLLYSSRNLAGGFTTGLKDAASLFSSAVEIAQSAKTSNAAEISGTLTSVSAIIGAVAPDLASGLVNNIVDAAIGGNSDTIVALRSLAGVNAGNTEFLRQLATNPQQIFVDLFHNLANMQTMSPDNYMEVAEGLSSVFGVDMKAFARVDFNNLANSIAAMNTNSATLQENMQLLTSGEATMSTEQLKLQEINNAILNEGLAYIIDSEAGRMIQQHMWDEQIANELEASTFAVEMQGAALSFLEGIRETIQNILNFLNPLGWLAKGIGSLLATDEEIAGHNDDIREVLELGAVGKNSLALSKLTNTKGVDLKLAPKLVTMMGGQAGVMKMPGVADLVTGSRSFGDRTTSASVPFNTVAGWQALFGSNGSAEVGSSSIKSKYSGFNVGKSALAALASPMASAMLPDIVKDTLSNPTSNARADSNKRMSAFFESVKDIDFENAPMTYEEWIATAKNYGIANYQDALADFGKSEQEVKGYFEASRAQAGAAKEEERKADEEKYREQVREFWGLATGGAGTYMSIIWSPFMTLFKSVYDPQARFDTSVNDIKSALSLINMTIMTTGGTIDLDIKSAKKEIIDQLVKIDKHIDDTFIKENSLFQKYLKSWLEYNSGSGIYGRLGTASAWNEMTRAEGERQNDALLALANAMEVFSADELKKLDPQQQANALLGKIVIILETMMQQNNTAAGGLSLMDTMSALGLGMTFNSKM